MLRIENHAHNPRWTFLFSQKGLLSIRRIKKSIPLHLPSVATLNFRKEKKLGKRCLLIRLPASGITHSRWCAGAINTNQLYLTF